MSPNWSILQASTCEERSLLVKTTAEEEEGFLTSKIELVFLWCKTYWILTTQHFFDVKHKFEFEVNYSFFQPKFGHATVRILFYVIIQLKLTLFEQSNIWHHLSGFLSHFPFQPKIMVRGRNFWSENSYIWKVQIPNFHWKKESSILDSNWQFSKLFWNTRLCGRRMKGFFKGFEYHFLDTLFLLSFP